MFTLSANMGGNLTQMTNRIAADALNQYTRKARHSVEEGSDEFRDLIKLAYANSHLYRIRPVTKAWARKRGTPGNTRALYWLGILMKNVTKSKTKEQNYGHLGVKFSFRIYMKHAFHRTKGRSVATDWLAEYHEKQKGRDLWRRANKKHSKLILRKIVSEINKKY